jgi:hypothetical protein
MGYISNSSAFHKPPEITVGSTADWRAWWRAESRRCGTDLQTLLRQHGRVLREFWQHAFPSS